MRSLLAAPVVIAAALVPACGARSGLPMDACPVAGGTQTCSDACGVGTRTCDGERWGACVVAPSSSPCANDCGTGTRRCEAGVLSACVVPVATRKCATVCGEGEEECGNGTWGACSAPPPRPPTLHCIVRDFSSRYPDFELPIGGNNDDRGLVAEDLAPDGTPVYRGGTRTLTTSGKANFDRWYHDAPGVNERTEIDLPLAADATPGFFVYTDAEFFPIDGRLLGNEGRPHNYHFTLQSHSEFDYAGGEQFSFTGDDDFWVFLNRRLAIDLGGVHESESAGLDLDGAAARLGLVRGHRYDIDLFFAERHTVGSNFMLRSSLALRSSCP